MDRCRRIMTLVATITAFLIVGPSFGQLGRLSNRPTLSAADIQDISDYVAPRLRRLAGDDPAAIIAARDDLISTFKPSRVSPTFREEFSRATMDDLKQAVESDKPLTVINAMIVMQFIASEEAMDVFVERANPANEKRNWVRLRAAEGAEVVLASGLVPQSRQLGFVRRLADSAAVETDGWVLRHQLAGLTLLLTDAQARKELIDALDALADRVATDEDPTAAVQGFRSVMARVAPPFPQLPTPDSRALGTGVAPIIVKFLDNCAMHISEGHSDRAFASAISDTETMLRIVDLTLQNSNRAPVPGSSPEVTRKWNTGNAEEYTAEVKLWKDITSRPPY